MAHESEARLREFGADDFTVLAFRAQEGQRVDLTDDFEFHNRLYFLNFEAKLRFLRNYTVRSRQEIAARVGAADWTPEETDRDLERIDLFEAQTYKTGAEVKLSAAAAFDDLEPGWRFDRLDSRRK